MDNEAQRESIIRFFKNIELRAWTDAEKELDNLRQNFENTQWNKGYTKALEGLLLTFRNPDDKYIFLPKTITNGKNENVQSLRKEFADFAMNDLHGEYDRGYFKAMEEYLESLTIQKSLGPMKEPGEQTNTEKSTRLESTDADTGSTTPVPAE